MPSLLTQMCVTRPQWVKALLTYTPVSTSNLIQVNVNRRLTLYEPLHWLHNERDGVSNHQPYDCLLNHLFRRRSKKTTKLCVTGLCEGNSPGTGEFPAQMASDSENVSIWWRHHSIVNLLFLVLFVPIIILPHQGHCFRFSPWWRHQMKTFFALLALCAGNSPVSDEFPTQRPATQSFDVFFDLGLNKRLSKQSKRWWFETQSCSLWRHRNANRPCWV